MYSTIFILSRVMMVVHDRWADGGAKMSLTAIRQMRPLSVLGVVSLNKSRGFDSSVGNTSPACFKMI